MRIWLGKDRCLFIEVRARCRHDVVGICPRCWPAESRTRRNRKLALAVAWLERLHTYDPHIPTTPEVQRIAAHALDAIANL